MAPPPATTSRVLFVLLLVALTAGGVSAANFYITNLCRFPVWPGVIPAGVSVEVKPGQTWHIPVPAGTAGGRIWARTDCYFVGSHGGCETGDCGGALSCMLSGKPPTTLAEFTIGFDTGALDYYDISVVDGFNVPMDFSCSTGGDLIRCREPGCPDASHPGEAKVRTCRGDSDYQVVFCS
ncbi:thaumatin-like protein [Phragmites australis]|uniref:thaumatin-like protein n=1 Tax=Phragmites australis TaxID=29695 RepID=UPI002D77EF1A|nr:thaumatin-like protein [Phragmites australis]